MSHTLTASLKQALLSLGFLIAFTGVVVVLLLAAFEDMLSAFRSADISATQPVKFLDLIWASGLGFLYFGNVPTQSTMIGAAVIFVASVWIARHEARRPAPAWERQNRANKGKVHRMGLGFAPRGRPSLVASRTGRRAKVPFPLAVVSGLRGQRRTPPGSVRRIHATAGQ